MNLGNKNKPTSPPPSFSSSRGRTMAWSGLSWVFQPSPWPTTLLWWRGERHCPVYSSTAWEEPHQVCSYASFSFTWVLEAVLGRGPGPILAYWRWDHLHGSPLCTLLLYFDPISEQLLKHLADIYLQWVLWVTASILCITGCFLVVVSSYELFFAMLNVF